MTAALEPDRTDEEKAEAYRRYLEAAPRMAAAFSEAGYPATFEPLVLTPEGPLGLVRNVISFRDRTPPPEVVRKAAAICGVADLYGPDDPQMVSVPHWAPPMRTWRT